MSDIGGAGGMLLKGGDKISLWLSHFAFMNFVLGALFMVKKDNRKEKIHSADSINSKLGDTKGREILDLE